MYNKIEQNNHFIPFYPGCSFNAFKIINTFYIIYVNLAIQQSNRKMKCFPWLLSELSELCSKFNYLVGPTTVLLDKTKNVIDKIFQKFRGV